MSPSPTPHRIAVAIKTSLLHICYIPLFVIASSGLPDLALEFASAWDKDMTFLPHLLTFCRITIGLLFAYSFLAKARDVNKFAQTITPFNLLPAHWSQPLALLFLSAELAVVILVLAGGQSLPIAFALALLLLSTFSATLLLVLARNIRASCNCFGHSYQPVTYADVWRNVGIILVAAGGLWATQAAGGTGAGLTFIEMLLLVIIASVFVLVWANLGDIMALFQTA